MTDTQLIKKTLGIIKSKVRDHKWYISVSVNTGDIKVARELLKPIREVSTLDAGDNRIWSRQGLNISLIDVVK